MGRREGEARGAGKVKKILSNTQPSARAGAVKTDTRHASHMIALFFSSLLLFHFLCASDCMTVSFQRSFLAACVSDKRQPNPFAHARTLRCAFSLSLSLFVRLCGGESACAICFPHAPFTHASVRGR